MPTASILPQPAAAPPPNQRVSFGEALRVWAKIGCLGFGGPAGQIALMHRELVERRRWIDEPRFLHALSYCTLLPGPEAQQLATYVGWLLHGTRGGIAAGLLFVLPGALAVFALSWLYASLHALPAVAALFFGLKAAVLALVVEALQRIARRALTGRLQRALALLAFVAIFALELPFPLIVFAAAALGVLASRLSPDVFDAAADAAARRDPESVIERMAAAGELAHAQPSVRRALRSAVVWTALWIAPLFALGAVFGRDSVFVEQGIFFSQTALVTFGGAYAVLAYVAQRAVADFGWLLPGEMLDGLGLAETTPGPLILVLQFVGFLGAWRQPGELAPLAAGLLGALVTLWVTFVPCFLWIFTGAPWVEALRGSRTLRAALSAITAAVVGVIANLTLWFGLHVLFARVDAQRFGPLRLLVPEWSSLDPAALVLALGAAFALLRLHLGVPQTLAACAALGALWRLAA